ncbi:MAG: hypothetical protein AVDCRST_MAG38-2862 [uncultured Solirubrobacteraceae bacterium]|uniref:DUF1275 domain-containing protein n=1 Tax=uncultured Solirubrobacteraceae bacterium TaxID=1162706 RepID=A0A6J4SC26_9ACTN|nr:MAG: hypothetical protein AVDCRST_MAG38-2862 [uncultured Solirubrobacteraceae bacterium]
MKRGRLRPSRTSWRSAVADDEYAGRLRVGWSGADDPPRRELPLVLLLLTFTTGLLDAVSYLGLGRVFSGIQTGNLVVLGFALAGTPGFSIAGPALSLAAFFAGAALGGRLANRLSRIHRRWLALALLVEALLVGLGALAAMGLPLEALGDWRTYAIIALLAGAMGLRSATIRRLAAPEVTTTVLTSTITSLATDAGTLSAAPGRQAWQLTTIAIRLLGAVAGAVLLRSSLILPLAVVTGLIVTAAAAYVTPVLLRAIRGRIRRWRRRRGDGAPPVTGNPAG